MNPRISVVLSFLKELKEGIENIILQYSEEADACYAYMYYDTNDEKSIPEKKEISFLDLKTIADMLLGINFNLGSDFKSLYTQDHRKVKYFRLILPSGNISMDYEDSSFVEDAGDIISENIREKFLKRV